MVCKRNVLSLHLIMKNQKRQGIEWKMVMTAFWGLAVFCFWAFVRPELLMERESFQLFLLNTDYLTERMSVPGGFSRYVGEFLIQFFMSEKTGACILALLLMAVQWLSWILLRRCLPTVVEKVLLLVSFLPAILLCYLLCDIDVSMSLPVGVLLTLLLMALLPSGNTSSLAESLLLIPLGYWLAGPVALLLAIYQLRFLHKPFKKVRVVSESIALVLLVGCCMWVSSYFVPYSLENIVKGIDYVAIQRDKYGTLEMMEYDYLQRQKAWAKVIEKARKEEPKAKACHHIVNLARFYQHEISPEELKMSLYKPFKALTSTTSAMMMSDLFFQMGFVNFSQRTMFEAMESTSNYNKSARALCRLTETAIVTGQYEVALKYISILEETLFYRRWAHNMRQLATHPENIKNHPKYGALQEIYGETDDELFI